MTRILDELDLHEELHRFAAVHDSMIVRQRDVHHRPNHDLAVQRNRAVLNLVKPEDCDLRRVEDGRAQQRAEDAAVRDRKGAALEIVEGQRAIGGALGEITDRQLEPEKDNRSASRITGTTRPPSAPTAMPMSK